MRRESCQRHKLPTSECVGDLVTDSSASLRRPAMAGRWDAAVVTAGPPALDRQAVAAPEEWDLSWVRGAPLAARAAGLMLGSSAFLSQRNARRSAGIPSAIRGTSIRPPAGWAAAPAAGWSAADWAAAGWAA